MKSNNLFNDTQLAKDLKAYQMRKGLTLSDIHKATGIDNGTLSRIRNGKDNALFIEVAILAFEMEYSITRYVNRGKIEAK